MARIVVALGGNALLKRGEALTATNQRANARTAAEALAPLCAEHEVVITHGNGPQVGLLALQELAYPGEDSPLDVLGAETEGAIGYMIEQELGNLLPFEKPLATLLTMVEVDPDDPAFQDPTKFVGQVYDEAEAKAEAAVQGLDGEARRRQVAPRRPLAAAEADLPAPPDPVAAGEGHRGDRRRRRRHPDDVREGHPPARRRRMRDRQGPRHRAPRPRDRRHRLRLRHRRRRRLSRLGQARPARDPPGHARRDGRAFLPGRLDGPEGRGGPGLRPRHRRPRHHLRPRRRAGGGARRKGDHHRRQPRAGRRRGGRDRFH